MALRLLRSELSGCDADEPDRKAHANHRAEEPAKGFRLMHAQPTRAPDESLNTTTLSLRVGRPGLPRPSGNLRDSPMVLPPHSWQAKGHRWVAECPPPWWIPLFRSTHGRRPVPTRLKVRFLPRAFPSSIGSRGGQAPPRRLTAHPGPPFSELEREGFRASVAHGVYSVCCRGTASGCDARSEGASGSSGQASMPWPTSTLWSRRTCRRGAPGP
jgi:hypothetical protein